MQGIEGELLRAIWRATRAETRRAQGLDALSRLLEATSAVVRVAQRAETTPTSEEELLALYESFRQLVEERRGPIS